MNSCISIVDYDGLSSYDIGTPSVTFHEVTRESKLKLNHSKPDLTLYLEPTILTHPVDPDTQIWQDEVIERLYVEDHIVSISTDILTPQLIALEEQRRIKAKALAESLNQNQNRHSLPNSIATSETKQAIEDNIENVVKHRRVGSLISIRLKSGELCKTSKELIEQLRAKSKKYEDVMKLEPRHNGNQIPFTDSLGNAVRRIQISTIATPKKNALNNSSRKNGRIQKVLKVRGALDKSTVALASTVRVKPKTSLLQQLDSMSRLAPPPPAPSTTVEQIIPSVIQPKLQPLPQKNQTSLVPVLMKWKSSSNHTKMLPLSAALHRIQTNTMHSDSRNGHQNGGVSP